MHVWELQSGGGGSAWLRPHLPHVSPFCSIKYTLSTCLSLGSYNKILQTGQLKDQMFISLSSGGWEHVGMLGSSIVLLH